VLIALITSRPTALVIDAGIATTRHFDCFDLSSLTAGFFRGISANRLDLRLYFVVWRSFCSHLPATIRRSPACAKLLSQGTEPLRVANVMCRHYGLPMDDGELPRFIRRLANASISMSGSFSLSGAACGRPDTSMLAPAISFPPLHHRSLSPYCSRPRNISTTTAPPRRSPRFLCFPRSVRRQFLANTGVSRLSIAGIVSLLRLFVIVIFDGHLAVQLSLHFVSRSRDVAGR